MNTEVFPFMKKRLLSFLSFTLVLLLTLGLAGCGKTKEENVISALISTSSKKPEVIYYNPLTGLKMDKAAVLQRPVAVMINNIRTAQEVQTGLNDADIVYELYAEGGITRLLAVFKDISKVGNIGSVRSGRYSHIDLAYGHDAIYVHGGINKSHAVPHIKELHVDNFDINSYPAATYGFRVKNGKASEHTLYSSGTKLNEGFSKLKYRRDLKKAESNWQAFVPADQAVTPKEGSCIDVSVTMSSSYITRFKYDKATGRYTRYSGSTLRKDYRTGKPITFKNILVLKTSTTHTGNKSGIVLTNLKGGTGYYLSNGGYQTVKWSKGAASNALKITLPDGTECPYNVGNTWVCLVDQKNAVTLTPENIPSSSMASSVSAK